MKKCECYHTRIVYDPYTQSQRFIEIYGECWGTKERDICYCKGDKCQCDIYPHVKQKALEEKELKQKERQKDNNLKHIKESLEFYLNSHEENGVFIFQSLWLRK